MDAKKRFDLVLFDLGDTLIYFDGNWGRVFSAMHNRLVDELLACGLMCTRQDLLLDFQERMRIYYEERDASEVEYTTLQVLTDMLHERGIFSLDDQAIQRVVNAMHTVSQPFWKLDEHSQPMLGELKEQGYKIGLISNASHAQDVRELLEIHRLQPYFDLAIISAEYGYRKPHPGIFKQALDQSGVSAGRAVMVGDTLAADIRGAKRSGIAAVWMHRYANRPDNRRMETEIRPDATIERLNELPELLQNWNF